MNEPFFALFYFTELNLPRFAEPIPNITVTIGKDALLACVVDNLKSYRVSYGQLPYIFVPLLFC